MCDLPVLSITANKIKVFAWLWNKSDKSSKATKCWGSEHAYQIKVHYFKKIRKS